MPEVLEAEAPTVITDSFDGTFDEPKEIVPSELIEKKEEVKVEVKVPEAIIEEVKPELEIPKVEVKAETFKYANAESEKIHKLILEGKKDEVADIIIEQRRLDKLLSATTTKETASEILKLKLEKTFAGLTKEQIDYKFNKMYGVPKEPVQKSFEGEEEFEERVAEWRKDVENSENDLLIDAEIAKPELAKFKVEIQLPDVSNGNNPKPLTPEELLADEEEAEKFLQTATEAINNFEGFNVKYKDKDVDIQSTYALSKEEKASVLSKMQTLAEKNYNSNAIFAERWVNDDGTFNFNQMTKDLAALETDDKRSIKYVSDATAKAKIAFIKSKTNIDFGKASGGEMQLEDKTIQQKKEDAIWGV